MIPPFRPRLGAADWGRLLGRQPGAVERFGRAVAARFGATEGVAFGYGRSALSGFLQAVGVEGADVVMPAYTCSVVAHAIVHSGNRPVFVDLCGADFNMDLERLPQAIGPKTRAVVATHLFGYPLDLERLELIVSEAQARFGHRIWLIQDCAHAFGARWKGRLAGTCGDVALYGLNISKTMTSIFGGMLTFQDARLAGQVRSWRDAHLRAAGWVKSLSRRAYLAAAGIAFTGPVYGLTRWLQDETPLLNR